MTTYLKDYQPTNFSISEVNLEFSIEKDFVTVINNMQLQRVSEGELFLHGNELTLLSIELNSVLLADHEYALSEQGLTLDNLGDELHLQIVTRIEPKKNTKLAGLFQTNSILCTQCEAHGFRRITYFYDRPDILTTYTTKITADKLEYPVLLSNGNLIASGDLDAGRHFATWHDPFKKPAYLFALVAGKLEHVADTFVTKSGKSIDLRIYVEPKDINKCSHAMHSLKNAMRWDEVVYGLEYDLATFMIVAVSDFNMGAMENKGLNIFNSKFILATRESATDTDYAGIEGVVAHEYFHNWTGNRVTCRDWFQLSLKEGLTVFRDQEFSRDMNSRAVNRIQDVRILRSIQFPEDAGSMAHPVRPTEYKEVNNFYTATVYNKGAEVIRMQHSLLGADGFRKGMDLYFARHDGQAVTINDFVAAMEDANQKDLSQFKYWYDKAGTPVVEVSSSFADNTLTLVCKQSCRKTSDNVALQAFHIPLKFALFTKDGQRIETETDILELREFKQTFEFTDLAEKPIVSLLRDFSAPIILKTDNSFSELKAILEVETDGFAKWDAAQTLVKQHLITNYHAKDSEQESPAELINSFRQILNDGRLDEALRAELLSLPSFEDLANEIPEISVKRALVVRDAFKVSLAKELYADAKAMYNKLWQAEEHSMQSSAHGPRKLRNICLQNMFIADEESVISICQQQFSDAATMTDKLASLTMLVKAQDKSIRTNVLQSFYNDWQLDELVIDKWFTVQAAADVPYVLQNAEQLLKHPDFKLTNPNRVRSLIGAFAQANPRYFHAEDGSGYAFIADLILQIDKINPQLSSRLATPFTRWQRFAKNHQELMLIELKKLAAHDLSVDLGELVAKSLEV